MATADVTVMGAGVFGLSIAYACARAGAAVRVIDPRGVAAGASGGIVGALAPHVPENWNAKKAFQLDSLLMAEGFWRGVETLAECDVGYLRTGRLQPLQDARAIDLARAREGTAASLWQAHARWEVISTPGGGWVPYSLSGMVVHDTLSALIHPRRATNSLGLAIKALGGEICAEDAREGAVVWATGWQGLLALNDGHRRTVGNGVKGQAALLRHDAAGLPQLFVDGLHIVPHSDGTVAIGSTSERDFDDEVSTDAQLEGLISKARAALPVLADAPVIARWAGVRPRSRSRAPMLGPHPFLSGEFIANGGFKIGFGMAPKVAQVMADLILHQRSDIPDDFLPSASL